MTSSLMQDIPHRVYVVVGDKWTNRINSQDAKNQWKKPVDSRVRHQN